MIRPLAHLLSVHIFHGTSVFGPSSPCLCLHQICHARSYARYRYHSPIRGSISGQIWLMASASRKVLRYWRINGPARSAKPEAGEPPPHVARYIFSGERVPNRFDPMKPRNKYEFSMANKVCYFLVRSFRAQIVDKTRRSEKRKCRQNQHNNRSG